ncbi:MAG: hypothetical protein WKF84_04145 [Pyrinomonadaceae bacterium]
MGNTLHVANPATTSIIAPSSPLPQVPMPGAPQATKGSSKFGRILGGLVGGALNIVVPGAGTAVGGLINQAVGGPDFAQMESTIAQTAIQQMQMLEIQTKVQTQTQEFTTITNLLKARHDGEMSAIHNIKS